MKPFVAILVCLLAVSACFAQKKLNAKITKEQATKVVLEQFKDATVKSAELEKEENKVIWSFDLKIGEGIKEVWVDANTGKIIKTEEESAVKEKEEQIPEKAEKAALKKVPGKIVEKTVLSENGKTIYAFEIKAKSGKTVEVKVDAKTNKVLKVEEEKEEKEDEEEEKDEGV
jgi:uncharacterized membrane protein YkoI